MKIEKRVYTTFRSEYFHMWEAEEAPTYLQALHRHLLHFRVEVRVNDSDREIEFIQLGNVAKKVWVSIYRIGDPPEDFWISIETKRFEYLCSRIHELEASCEEVAEAMCEYLIALYDATFVSVEVSEDGENGSVVTFDKRSKWEGL